MEIIDPRIIERSSGDDGTSQLVPARRVQDRYDIADRTLDRWLASAILNFPRPLIINKRRYFRVCELVDWERRQARAHLGDVA